ncbi:MAG TPA: class I SAM-dependent methyltransferase [Streptosporangiaceae bacterium]|nr:class I SAM-dependent methyltransferase [Streptosporangiaceae bacterium]
MTQQGQAAAAIWREADFARSWAQGDAFRDMLEFPRRIAAAVVAADNPEPACIVDIGSGPGAVLAVFLEQFPSARGIWTDASQAMFDLARERLAPFGDRVDYHIVDMTDLAASAVPSGVDVITTSRAAHHLDREGLFAFYSQAAAKLAPGGWLVNLDHIGPDDVWDKRLRAVRKQFAASPEGPKHHHNYPLTSVSDHLEAYAAAGITDVEVVWRAFYTCLFMGRTGS